MKNEVAATLLKKYGKHNPPTVSAGDTVRVHQRIREGDKERIQIFEGLVIATKHGMGLDGTFTVRKIATGGIGVERTYPMHSPNVVKVERTKTADVVRAKLYYMRDRLGKAARFKSETRTPMTWDESGKPTEVVDEMTDQEATEVLEATEEVVVTPEGSIEAAVLEESAAADETPTETEEVIAAVEGEALSQETEEKDAEASAK
jgi:large subunit ribosomal protein L19